MGGCRGVMFEGKWLVYEWWSGMNCSMYPFPTFQNMHLTKQMDILYLSFGVFLFLLTKKKKKLKNLWGWCVPLIDDSDPTFDIFFNLINIVSSIFLKFIILENSKLYTWNHISISFEPFKACLRPLIKDKNEKFISFFTINIKYVFMSK